MFKVMNAIKYAHTPKHTVINVCVCVCAYLNAHKNIYIPATYKNVVVAHNFQCLQRQTPTLTTTLTGPGYGAEQLLTDRASQGRGLPGKRQTTLVPVPVAALH